MIVHDTLFFDNLRPHPVKNGNVESSDLCGASQAAVCKQPCCEQSIFISFAPSGPPAPLASESLTLAFALSKSLACGRLGQAEKNLQEAAHKGQE